MATGRVDVLLLPVGAAAAPVVRLKASLAFPAVLVNASASAVVTPATTTRTVTVLAPGGTVTSTHYPQTSLYPATTLYPEA